MADKYLMYRKTMLKNIYNSSKVFDEIMDYEEYKESFLNDLDCSYKYFSYLKGLKKCYLFLLNASISLYNPLVINVLHNLLFKENLTKEKQIAFYSNFIKEDDMYLNITSLLKITKETNNYKKYLFSLILIIYIIYLHKKQMYRFSNKFFKELYKVTTLSFDYKYLNELIKVEIEKAIVPDETYFDNLTKLNSKQVTTFLLKNKDYINDSFNVSHLYLYGSFSKDNYRIDSDIDVALIFKDNLSYDQKKENAELLKKYILKNLKRYGDVCEYNETLLQNEYKIKIY